jgi:hypothetical protein
MECQDESSFLQVLGDSEDLAVYTRLYSNVESAEKRGQGRVVKSSFNSVRDGGLMGSAHHVQMTDRYRDYHWRRRGNEMTI